LKKYEELARLQKEKLEIRNLNLTLDRSSGNNHNSLIHFSVNLDSKSSKMDAVNKFKNKLKDFVTNYTQIMKDMEKLNLSRLEFHFHH
jgi:hypothetical protein